MNENRSRNSGRRSGRGSRRSGSRPQSESRGSSRGESRSAEPAAKKTLWQKIVSIFRPAANKSTSTGRSSSTPARADRPVYEPRSPRTSSEPRQSRKPEAVEVTTPKLYVGNLSFDATENDLLELFNGVGKVQTAEIVAHKQTEKSKGFGFVIMTSVEEAKRAVTELHDKEFLGRKLVVSGAKTADRF